MREATAAVLALVAGLTGCSSRPISAADVQRYTGIRLCKGADLRDLTTTQELDTTPGFSFHVQIHLQPACDADFQKQLADLSAGQCSVTLAARGCSVEDTSVHDATRNHTSLAVTAEGKGGYDLRFYE